MADQTLVSTARKRTRRFRGRYRALAARTGVSYSWITKFSVGLRGLRRPSYTTLTRLVAALDALEAEDAAKTSAPTPHTVRVRRRQQPVNRAVVSALDGLAAAAGNRKRKAGKRSSKHA